MTGEFTIADGITQARMMLMHGDGNVFSVQAVMDEGMTEGTKTLTES